MRGSEVKGEFEGEKERERGRNAEIGALFLETSGGKSTQLSYLSKSKDTLLENVK